MPNISELKKVLQDPKAIGWIGLMVVAMLIGLGTLYYGGRDNAKDGPPVSHAAR